MSELICAKCGHGNDGAASVCATCDAPLNAASGDWVGLAGGGSEAADDPVPTPMPAPLSPSDEEHRIPTPGGDFADLERAAAASADDAAASAEPEPRKSMLWPLLLIAVVVGGYFGWTMFGQGPQMAAVEAEPDAAAHNASALGGRPAWQASYADTFLSPETVIMTVAVEAKQRDYPSTDGTAVARERREGEMISGRWVRGADGASRWLKLSDGGYIRDSNLAVAGGPGSPIAIPFSNRDTSFGPDIGRYLEQASAIIEQRYARADTMPPKEQAAYLESIETESAYVRVPNRRFHGLTITAVVQYYEGSGIIFRESEAVVIAALRAAGIVISDGGDVPLSGDHAEGCTVAALAADDRERHYGVTQLTCGV
ncbi:MAG: hypothetical protein AABZ45_00960 [Pseudomonadota bacterium]